MAKTFEAKYFTGSFADLVGGRSVSIIAIPKIMSNEKGLAAVLSSSNYLNYSSTLFRQGITTIVVIARITGVQSLFTTSSNALGFYGNYNGTPMLRFGLTQYKLFNFTCDKNFHCYVISYNSYDSLGLQNSTLHIDNNLIPVGGGSNYVGALNDINMFSFVGGGGPNKDISYLAVHDTVLTVKEREQYQRMFEQLKPITKVKRGLQLNKPTDLSSQKNRGLVAAYNMKPIGNTLVDISGNGKNITIAKLVSSYNGMKYSNYPTSNQYPIIPISDATVSYRLNTGNSLSTSLFSFADLASYYIIFTNTEIRIYDSSIWYIICSGLNLNNRSCTFTFTLDRTTKLLSAYINGILKGTYTLKSTAPNSIYSILGNNNVTSLQVDSEYVDIIIYNRILSLQEIKAYHNQFVKQPYLIEDFSDQPADGTNIVPTGWIKGTGNYKVGEFVKRSGSIYSPLNFTNTWTTITATINNENTFTTTTAQGLVRRNDGIIVGRRYTLKITGNTTGTNVTIMDFATNTHNKKLRNKSKSIYYIYSFKFWNCYNIIC